MIKNAEKPSLEHIEELEQQLEIARCLLRLDRKQLEKALDVTGLRCADDLLRQANRSFELAYYVLGEEERAYAAMCAALRKLGAELEQDQRRRVDWWRKSRGRRPRKGFFEPPQRAQLLLLLETTVQERLQEREHGSIGFEDALIRNVKQLVEAAFDLRSWHLNAALSCLLRGLSLKQSWRLQRLLELGTRSEEPKAFVSDPLRRRLRDARAKIETILRQRFDTLARETSPHAAWRSLTREQRRRWNPVIEATLDRLDPWEVKGFWTSQKSLPDFRQTGESPGAIGRAESVRKAALINPGHYARLAKGLDLGDSCSRWHVPPFLPQDETEVASPPPPPTLGGRRPVTALGEEQILELVAGLAQDARVRADPPTVLAVSLDGQVLRRWHTRDDRELVLEIDPLARRLELLAEIDPTSPESCVPVATLWVQHFEVGESLRALGSKQRLRIRLEARGSANDRKIFRLRSEAQHFVRHGWPASAQLTQRLSFVAGLVAIVSLFSMLSLTYLLGSRDRPPSFGPVAGVSFSHLDLASSVERGDAEHQVIELPQHARHLVVVIQILEVTDATKFDVELESEEGLSWNWHELQPIDGELSIALPIKYVGVGTYHLRLEAAGRTSAPWEAEVLFEVTFHED